MSNRTFPTSHVALPCAGTNRRFLDGIHHSMPLLWIVSVTFILSDLALLLLPPTDMDFPSPLLLFAHSPPRIGISVQNLVEKNKQQHRARSIVTDRAGTSRGLGVARRP